MQNAIQIALRLWKKYGGFEDGADEQANKGAYLRMKKALSDSKANLKKLKTDINIKNPTITSPKSGKQIPATKTNLKKIVNPIKKKIVTPPKIEQKPVKQFDGKSFNDFIKDIKDKNKKLGNQKLNIPNPIKTTPPKIETPLRKPFDPINPTKIKTKPSLFKKLKPFAKGATKVLKRNKWLAIALGVGALTQAYRQALKPRTKTTTTTTNNNSNKNLIAPMKTTDTFKPVDARIRLGPGKDILLPPTK